MLVDRRENEWEQVGRVLPGDDGSARSEYWDQIFSVKAGDRVVLIRKNDISHIRAEANYVRLIVGRESYRVRRTLSSLLERLDPRMFIRVHRSVVVNVRSIQELLPCNSGEFLLLLRDGITVPTSRNCRSALQPFLDRML